MTDTQTLLLDSTVEYGIVDKLRTKNNNVFNTLVWLDALNKKEPAFFITFVELINNFNDKIVLMFLPKDKLTYTVKEKENILDGKMKAVYEPDEISTAYIKQFISNKYNISECHIGNCITSAFISYQSLQYYLPMNVSKFRNKAIKSVYFVREGAIVEWVYQLLYMGLYTVEQFYKDILYYDLAILFTDNLFDSYTQLYGMFTLKYPQYIKRINIADKLCIDDEMKESILKIITRLNNNSICRFLYYEEYEHYFNVLKNIKELI